MTITTTQLACCIHESLLDRWSKQALGRAIRRHCGDEVADEIRVRLSDAARADIGLPPIVETRQEMRETRR